MIYKEPSKAWGQLVKNIKTIDTKKKTLLLLHGTWSSTEASFEDLLSRDTFISNLAKKKYNTTILSPLRKLLNTKNVSFGDIFIYFN
ncbi:MAG: hypothetical protein ACJATI_004066 [Halioglobus sp.]